MSNKENVTTIAAEEIVVTNYSNNIFNHLEDSEKMQQVKMLKSNKESAKQVNSLLLLE